MRFGHDPLHYAFQKDLTWSFRERFQGLDETGHLPVFAAELRRLAPRLPLAIRETATGIEPVVLVADQWLARAALDDEGRWLSGTMPQALAVHPFKVIGEAESDRRVPVVAQDDACVGTGFTYRFFEPSGEMSLDVRRVIRRLHLLENGRDRLAQCAKWLREHDLLTALPEAAAGQVVQRRRVLERFWTVSPEKVYEISPAMFLVSGDNLPILTRLMAALLVSQRALPMPIRKKIMTAGAPSASDRMAKIVFAHQADNTDAAGASSEGCISQNPDDSFLVDDSAVLQFDFTASGSVFNRG